MTSPKLQFYRTLRIGFLRLPIIGKILALRQLKKLLPLSMLHRHGYIVGKSGSGKSEFLKLLVLLLKITGNVLPWASKIEQSRSVLLLDPHGDVASECARQRCFYAEYQGNKSKGISGNMVFISPSLGDKVFPTLNPFDIRNKGYGDSEIEVIAQNLTRAFTAMLSKGDVTLSLHMKTLLTPMLSVLLTLSNESGTPMTFFDLVRFLDEERNHDLVEAGQKLSNEGQRHFFTNLFGDRKFMATKFSLKTKLASLLNSQMFVELLSRGHSTWDLEALLNSGKTVIVSASKSDLGADVSEMYGRTITALTQSYVLMRGRSGCAECKGNISSQLQKGHRYYHCTRWRLKSWGQECNHRKYYREEWLEEEIIKKLRSVTLHPDFLEWSKDVLKHEHEQEITLYRSEHQSLQHQLQILTVKKENLLNLKLSPANKAGALLDDQEFLDQKMKYQREISEIKQQLETGNPDSWFDRIEDFFQFSKSLSEGFQYGDSLAKREILRTIGQLLLNHGEMALELKKPYVILPAINDFWNAYIEPSEPPLSPSESGNRRFFRGSCPEWRTVWAQIRTYFRTNYV